MKFHQIDLLDGYGSVQLPKHVFFFINEVLRSIEVPSAACSTLLLPPLFASLGIREVMDRKPCADDKPCAVYSTFTAHMHSQISCKNKKSCACCYQLRK